MTRSLITWFFVGWFSLIFIVSRFQSILKFNVLYDFAILRMKLGVKGLINVPLLRNCSIVRSTIGWFDIVIVRLGDSVHFGFFSENFLFSLLFSFWGLFPSRIFLLKAFSFRCDYFGFFGNFLLPMSIFFFEVFFIFYLHAWLDPCGPGNYFPMVWIFFFSDLIFSDASTWSSYLHARGSIRAVLPFFSSTFDPSFRMFRRRILGFYLECFGHRFHNCMAIHFSDARLWFIFLLTFSSASISFVVGVSFLLTLFRLFETLSPQSHGFPFPFLAFGHFPTVVVGFWLFLSRLAASSRSTEIMVVEPLRFTILFCKFRPIFSDASTRPQETRGGCVTAWSFTIFPAVWRFLAIHYWWGTSQIYRKWSPGVGPAVRRSALEPSASPHR